MRLTSLVRERRRGLYTVVLALCLASMLAGTGALLVYGARTSAAVRPGAVANVAGAVSRAARPLTSRPALPSAGCGSAPAIHPGATGTLALGASGLRRSALVHLPPTYTPRTPLPLLLSFHGTNSTAAIQQRMTGFSQLADAQHFIAVYPQGTLGSNGRTGWASGGPGHPTINDVGFVAGLLTTVQAHYCVDLTRIYATGFSNGGGMTALLACRLAGRVAAFASVSGSYYPYPGGCVPGRPVPLLEFHGTGDHIVPYTGRARTHLMPVMTWLSDWAMRDRCSNAPRIHQLSAHVMQYAWTACSGGVSIVHYQILGGVHMWPALGACASVRTASAACGGDASLPATSLIWRFLVQYRLPAAPARTVPAAAQPTSHPARAGAEARAGSGQRTGRVVLSGAAGGPALGEEPGQQRVVRVNALSVPDAVLLSGVFRVTG